MSIKTFELISTTENGIQLISYVALPEAASDDNPVAGILVAPEWWGVVEHPKNVTERLAKAGYAAVAMDVYGEGKLTSDAAQANMWMEQVLADQDMLMARCRLILNDFSDQLAVDSDNLGAIGYCFGGKIVLDMAREGMPLKAVATFHGNPSPKQPADKQFSAKVLVAHGRDDSMVSMDAIEGLKAELDGADIDYTIDVYDGAKHGFTNPNADERAAKNGVDLGYNETAAKQSWDNMLEFMKDNLA
ncbi:probable dienelactone hydrolase [Psychrobacter arcticus 273-4]|uniref:Probable dienelactone hydrolase n=1 Tax=Psychrobacter arcticus (strain DSM 17307 / VKM B-2377 / 273-4) TaxID=259536 RepID=Q4FQ81_PSYA2|nr:dienelactone hydrolase family protein [Psychrobacter arcticus]AAZ19827.1 probable dienelactone hydrolase [Psychrobacter arcticus 273-4]